MDYESEEDPEDLFEKLKKEKEDENQKIKN